MNRYMEDVKSIIRLHNKKIDTKREEVNKALANVGERLSRLDIIRDDKMSASRTSEVTQETLDKFYEYMRKEGYPHEEFVKNRAGCNH